MISFLQTLLFSAIIIFIIHQIYSFISVPAPKIKFAAIEKYKTLLENAAAAPAVAFQRNQQSTKKNELVEITDEFDIETAVDSSPFDDDMSVYSDGFTAIKNEMEDDLLRAVLFSAPTPPPPPQN